MARDLFKQALSINEELGRPKGIALQRTSLAMISGAEGDWTAALEGLNAARTIYKDIGDQRGLGEVLYNLGHVHEMRKNYDAAALAYRAAIELLDKSGDLLHQAWAWLRLGLVLFLGNGEQHGDQIITILRNAYRRAIQADDRNLMGEAAFLLGISFELQGEKESARTAYQESATHFELADASRAAEVTARLQALGNSA